MNENLNLVEILKDVPEGTKLYSPVFGVVTFDGVTDDSEYPIKVINADGEILSFTKEGLLFIGNLPGSECVLFPSKEQRDWSKFKVKRKKVKIELKPLDKVLMRDNDNEPWQPGFFFSLLHGEYKATNGFLFTQCIPFNAGTEHLVFNTGKPDVDYDIIEWKTGKHGE